MSSAMMLMFVIMTAVTIGAESVLALAEVAVAIFTLSAAIAILFA